MLLLLAVAGCGEPPPAATPAPDPLHELRGEALGTTWMVKWRGPDLSDAVRGAATRALGEVDAGMSTWRDDSELARVRAADGPVAVSEATAAVITAALGLAEATGGAFDPTVQPLVELWGFHGDRRTTLPSDAELAEAMARVGHHKVRLTREEGQVRVDAGGTALDLSAIAKGHAVDRVSWSISALGLTDHMVEVGGEVRAHGRGPSGGPWRLGVDTPVSGAAPGRSLEAVVELANRAMATSGNYRNTYEVDGVRVVHTLDPRTGRPHTSDVASATVLAPDCQTADGWATALMVLGREGLPLIEARPQLEAMLLVVDGDGFRQVRTSGFSPARP